MKSSKKLKSTAAEWLVAMKATHNVTQIIVPSVATIIDNLYVTRKSQSDINLFIKSSSTRIESKDLTTRDQFTIKIVVNPFFRFGVSFILINPRSGLKVILILLLLLLTTATMTTITIEQVENNI